MHGVTTLGMPQTNKVWWQSFQQKALRPLWSSGYCCCLCRTDPIRPASECRPYSGCRCRWTRYARRTSPVTHGPTCGCSQGPPPTAQRGCRTDRGSRLILMRQTPSNVRNNYCESAGIVTSRPYIPIPWAAKKMAQAKEWCESQRLPGAALSPLRLVAFYFPQHNYSTNGCGERSEKRKRKD